jgi:hypothetical protein
VPHIENDSAQTITTTTETIVGAFGSLELPAQPYQVPVPVPAIIVGTVNITPGTTTTAVVVRVRQAVAAGTPTGAVVGVAESNAVTAAVASDIPFEANDQTGSVTGWVVTVQQTGATANGTVNLVSADANLQ